MHRISILHLGWQKSKKNICSPVKEAQRLDGITNPPFRVLYMQVRLELIYLSEISYLIVHLQEKAREDASFDMTLKQ